MKFPYLLFDADDTLFDFPKAAARAFSAMCRSNGVPDTLDTRALYHRINQELWAAFDRGEVSKDYVTLERFVRFFQALKLPRDPDKCNRDYLTALGAGVYPLPHAEAVCRELVRRGHKLYIVTNAVASVQRSRLQGSVFADSHHGRLYFRGRRSLQAGPGLLCLCPLPHTRPDAGERSRDRRLPLHRHPGRQQCRTSLLLVQSCWKGPAGGPADRL